MNYFIIIRRELKPFIIKEIYKFLYIKLTLTSNSLLNNSSITLIFDIA
ncbi:MAG: hypothetical protein K0Q49_1751 [Haloplasmataceae bacterium]|nr:hypothetical protein [Haloplasmataceae bacterium]